MSDRVVEVAVVRTDPWGRSVGEWSSRLNPGRPVTATHVHGITEADVANAPAFTDIVPTLNEFLAGVPVVAHNGAAAEAIVGTSQFAGLGLSVRRSVATPGWDAALLTELAQRWRQPDEATVPALPPRQP
jgi:DNA polymerase III epsilon subunit-like protein